MPRAIPHVVPQLNPSLMYNFLPICICPFVQVCSEYHYLVLYADRLVAVNQVSGKVVSEVNWGPGVHASGVVGTVPEGIVRLLFVSRFDYHVDRVVNDLLACTACKHIVMINRQADQSWLVLLVTELCS